MAKPWMEAIAERKAQLGVDTVVRMAKIFVGDAKSQLKTITGALGRNELATARQAAHDLTANAGSLCFIVLEQAARDCETACVNNERAKAVEFSKGLPALVDMCLLQLRDRYKVT